MTSRQDAVAALTAPGAPFEIGYTETNGSLLRYFVNAPASLGDIYLSARSTLPFIIYGEERLSFDDVWIRSCSLAHALVEDYRVEPGDRVAISMRNYPEWMIGFAAVTAIGGIAVAMNAQWRGDALALLQKS